MLKLLVTIHVLVLQGTERARRRFAADDGQSTAEYALVLLGAAAIALLLVAWATKTDRITKVMNSVLDRVLDQVK